MHGPVKVISFMNRFDSELRLMLAYTTVLLACVALASCSNGPAEIWSAKVLSPDGSRVAHAYTLQSSGMGTASVGTGVYIERPGSSTPSTQVAGFGNESAYPAGVTAVKLTWVGNSRLEVTYAKGAELNFKAAQADGVEIAVHKD
jgi:hypothetical protein